MSGWPANPDAPGFRAASEGAAVGIVERRDQGGICNAAALDDVCLVLEKRK